MKVLINTRDVQSLRTESAGTKWINWADSSDRKWLMNHLHWAMHNSKTVTLSPAVESN